MKIKGRLKDFDFDYSSGTYALTLLIDDANVEEVNKLKNRTLICDVKELEKARTISQNRFFWEIVTKIANHPEINTTKDEVYEQMLQQYGEPIAEVKTEVLQDFGKADVHYILSKIGRKYNYYLVVKGISLMTTKEMTAFIEHALTEAKELGIDTTPPWEWERLKNLWQQNQ